MIKLTLRHDGSTIYLNPLQISAVKDNGDTTYVSMVFDGEDIFGYDVKENAAQVVKQIQEDGKRT